MLKNIFILIIAITCLHCRREKEKVDLVVCDAKIYTVDRDFSVQEAMAIHQGKIIAVGDNKTILRKFEGAETLRAGGRAIYPGFIDAHCHFLAYGLGLSKVNLVGTTSFNEVLSRVAQSSAKSLPNIENTLAAGSSGWLLGRGWDQNDWENKAMPTNRALDSLFPGRPVFLTRIDGHAGLANTNALRMAGITSSTKIKGGEVVLQNGKPTGLLIDNAMDLVKKVIPVAGNNDKTGALLNAQDNCLAVGLTTVDDAGLMKEDVDLVDSLQKAGKLKMRMYAMLTDSQPNYDYYLVHGPYKTERLNVRSFKFYADGALGSRGACLFKDYNDQPGWKGFLLSDLSHFEKHAVIMNAKGFQMNTHCIGDSALDMVMDIYQRFCNKKALHRWRIEHAQVITGEDFKNFSADIIPSVQPTHATSDMYWAEKRLGKRIKYAYAYKDLLDAAGIIALGTDFPVEDISPFKTFFAAVARQDTSGYPPGGFQPANALSRKDALKGMTSWAAYSNFEENEKGSLEENKLADFVILDRDIMTCAIRDALRARVVATYINGEKVYSSRSLK
jgi:predicted amidohydrolase YtcJ